MPFSRQIRSSNRRCLGLPQGRPQLVVGHAAPWDETEGQLRQRISVENACDLARRYLHLGIDVVLSDVLSSETAGLYRHLLPGILIVQVRLPLAEARRRANLRPVYLTEDEFNARTHCRPPIWPLITSLKLGP